MRKKSGIKKDGRNASKTAAKKRLTKKSPSKDGIKTAELRRQGKGS